MFIYSQYLINKSKYNHNPSLVAWLLLLQLGPKLLVEVILHVVIVPVVLPDAQLFLVLLGAGPVFGGELLEFVVFLEQTEVNLGLFLVLLVGHGAGNAVLSP
uniref:(northern house mosquito) hypothetical protein n=1 Tax=Culex pipiens TaxID=7175 RepID=A0A8D8K8A8_CULPI